MKKSSIVWAVVIVVIIAVVVAGYFWRSSTPLYQSPVATTQTSTSTMSPTSPTSPTMSPTAPQSTPVHAFTLNNSGGGIFGAFLSAANGMTLYQYTKDADNVSNCTGACAIAWPPYTVSVAVAASPTADPGIAGKIGTIKRADGSLQLTYRGLPLYFFAQDTKPGDTKGEAVNGFTEVAP
jgi:predicted lipoprotein with Yx(FWY)xxD motif